jgi:hypothetical protein
MAAFSLSNWLQATEINVEHKEANPHTIPSASSDVKHCKEMNVYHTNIRYNEAIEEFQ